MSFESLGSALFGFAHGLCVQQQVQQTQDLHAFAESRESELQRRNETNEHLWRARFERDPLQDVPYR